MDAISGRQREVKGGRGLSDEPQVHLHSHRQPPQRRTLFRRKTLATGGAEGGIREEATAGVGMGGKGGDI